MASPDAYVVVAVPGDVPLSGERLAETLDRWGDLGAVISYDEDRQVGLIVTLPRLTFGLCERFQAWGWWCDAHQSATSAAFDFLLRSETV